jgi:nicotinamide phosphoribosyltransferase
MTIDAAIQIDGYKLDHRRQYGSGVTAVYSNWTPRGSRVAEDRGIIFFGLQYFLLDFLGNEWGKFFASPIEQVTKEYEDLVNSYLGPNSIGTEHIEALHNLGYLPLRFKAFPEGCFVPLRVPAMTVENTHPDFFWLTNYIETILSCYLWGPCTSATTAFAFRKILEQYARLTGSPEEFVDWQGHDFSFRGMMGPQAAAMSGAGHLVFFTGTDTIPALRFVSKYYGQKLPDNYLIGGSVAATEHSVMSAGGHLNEGETFAKLLDLYPSGIVSVVSDTWDLWKVLTEILPKLKNKILAREGKLVIRPDSGDPVKIICGDPSALDENARKGVVQILWDTFGGTITSTGHKLLDPHIGAIYGDSINRERLAAILEGLSKNGFASANMVFGVGSYTYQYVTRDTYGFAMKATWAEKDGAGCDLWKKPITDSGEKFSAKGRLAVLENDFMEPVVVSCATPEQEKNSLLQTVWENGILLQCDNFQTIRARAQANI